MTEEILHCNNCTWFVEETETIGDYSHEEAVKQHKGFCLVQDLFTMVEPNTIACKEFNNDGRTKNKTS